MIDDIKGFFEVHKQGTNGALVIKGFHPRMLDLPGRQPNWFMSREGSNNGDIQPST